ncbi:MAG: glycerate kinase family protein [Solirubrobacteraceae bacterium]
MGVKGIPATVLVAPDSFKGTFSASEVAGAIARGLEAGGCPVDRCPVADGGEGTLEALLRALGGERASATAHDPRGRSISTCYGLIPAGPRRPACAIVETAAASGLGLVAPAERDAVAASTFGTGELILAAVATGAQIVYLGAGGSATTDGGSGAIQAIREGGGLHGARLVVLCDVRTPFEDAARVFAPQKGADTGDVRRLTNRLHALARGLERDPRGVLMSGAAGGMSGGLWSAFEAELVPGASFVLDAVGFGRRMRSARAVVTGEGKLDRQSLAGKAISEVATRARQAGVPCHAIVGTRELDAFGARILDLQAVREAQTLEAIERAGRELAEAV